MGDAVNSQKKSLTADTKARLVNDISIAIKQMEEEEMNKKKLKSLADKLVKENHELRGNNDMLTLRLTKVEEDLSETKRELDETKSALSVTNEELAKLSKLLTKVIAEQDDQKEIIYLLSDFEGLSV